MYRRRAEPVLVSPSDSYSELDSISIRASSTLFIYLTLSTNYLTTFILTIILIELYMNIHKERMPTLNRTCRRSHYSSI